MYHIPDDERAKRSAEKIYQSLRHILFKKKLDEISITDIQKECGISRSTFYRLFDTTLDVLAMKLTFFIDEYYQIYAKSQNELLAFYTYWDKHSTLIYLLSTQAEFIIKDVLKQKLKHNSVYDEYYIEVQAATLSALLCKWVERGKKETPQEMSQISQNILSNPQKLLTIF